MTILWDTFSRPSISSASIDGKGVFLEKVSMMYLELPTISTLIILWQIFEIYVIFLMSLAGILTGSKLVASHPYS
jgi:hypothetical protein